MLTTSTMRRDDGGPDSYVCDNCEAAWPFDKLEDISDIEERVCAGNEVPAGECPTCGALCYPVEKPKQEVKPRAVKCRPGGYASIEDFFAATDWPELRRQKRALTLLGVVARGDKLSRSDKRWLDDNGDACVEGLLNFLDGIGDLAEDHYGQKVYAR